MVQLTNIEDEAIEKAIQREKKIKNMSLRQIVQDDSIGYFEKKFEVRKRVDKMVHFDSPMKADKFYRDLTNFLREKL